jgi:2-dehydropantoate 2-reductase
MHVLILGAGAMGSLVGARLAKTGARLSLLSTNRAHIRAIQEDGLCIEELDGTESRHALSAFDDLKLIQGKIDLVIVLVKSYATDTAVAGVRGLSDTETVFLTLQNGVGNWQRIARVVGERAVLVGSTAQGATLVAPGRIRHGGNGPTFIGEPEDPPSQRVWATVELFRSAGLETQASDQMEQLIWEKLHVNVGINAITALTGIRNGVIAQVEAAVDLSRAAVLEAMLVAKAMGFSIREDMVERVIAIARATAVNRSSMGQDVDRKKRTEIDAINGAIVQYGEELGIATPVNRTLTQLVKVMEANYSLNI